MALFKNKWEIKSWAELSSSVADVSNDLEFRSKHRLPYSLQQGAKASKTTGGWFNRESIIKTTGGGYDGGYYIYGTGSGLSYTAMPKANFKSDINEFLQSSSISPASLAQISTSFNATDWSDIIVQIDETITPPATASWNPPAAFIGTGSGALSIINTSTNTTNIKLRFGGALITGSIYDIEYTLPMETINFTPDFDNQSLTLSALTGSEYTPEEYNNSVIYTPHAGSEQTSSIVGKLVGSGSLQSYANGTYSGVEHSIFLMALGDGLDAIYNFTPKHTAINFPTGTPVVSASYKIYGEADTSKSTLLTTRTIYFVSGSSTSPNYGATGGGGYSGSHLFNDAALTTPANPGIYVPNWGGIVTGYLVPTTSETTPVFNGQTY